jgi:hypothetical protein
MAKSCRHFKSFHAAPRRFALLTGPWGRTGKVRVLLDFLAYSGIGWIAMHTIQTFRTRKAITTSALVENPEEFDHKVDLLWNSVKNGYKMIAVRDQKTLNLLYPKSSLRFKRLDILENQEYIGWAVLLATPMNHHKQFGSMRVGSIVDCLAHADNAGKILGCAEGYLRNCGVDILVANHSHKSWCNAFEELGFIRGPSNFLCKRSPGGSSYAAGRMPCCGACGVGSSDGTRSPQSAASQAAVR